MATFTYDGLVPRIHPTAYVHPSAQVIGEVSVDDEASVWPTAVLRGDAGAISIGARTNFQDASVAHATTGLSRTTVGTEVTIGHRVILHGCTVGHSCLIGMGSILLDGVEVGDQSFVAAGTLLTPGKKFEPRSFIVGSPGKRLREVTADDLEWIAKSWLVYRDLAKKYRAQGL